MTPQFKEPHLKEQYETRPPLLLQICADFCALARAFDIEPVVTRVTDPVAHESGVHPAGRAVDFRDVHGIMHNYSEAQIAAIVEHLNFKYKRTDGKPVIIHHAVEGSTKHFHIQISVEQAQSLPSS